MQQLERCHSGRPSSSRASPEASQVEIFREIVEVNGLVITKLDGTARGGVLVALAERFKLPVAAIGVGEGIDDLRPFDAQAFARNLLGLEAQ